MVKQMLNKFIVVLIVLVLTSGNLVLIGTETYAAFENLEEQKRESSDKNVSFDAYFYTNQSKIHSATLDTKQEAYMNFEVDIENGYLKESVIELNNANFEIESIEAQSIDGIVKNFDSNKIEINQINNNKTVTITAKIKEKYSEYVDQNFCSKESQVNYTSQYTNIKGETKQINATTNIGLTWVANNITSAIDQNVEKYMQLENKSIIQTKVISTLNENVLPIKNTNINITVPKVNNNLPEEVRVYANSTIGTNGIADGNSFNSENWNYNQETGEITINVENQVNADGKISWKKGSDEYIVMYIYNTLDSIPTIELNAKNTITTYGENTVESNVNKVQETKINGNAVDYEITSTEKTNKGYIYANSTYETPYTETLTANISYKNASQGLVFTKDVETYNLENGKNITADTIYKNTAISKANFEKILGQDGKINIYNGENLITTLDNNTNVDENGNLVVNYETNYNNIRIETTQPVEEGKLVITNNKAISAKSTYDYNTQKTIKSIESTLIGQSSNQENQIKKSTTILEETSSKAQVQIGKQDLSTVITNENVEIRAILESDDITDDLYKNPTVKIELPEEIENINIKSVNVLFNNEIQLVSSNVEAGRIINLILTGEQTQYITDNNKGITIIINTDITVKKAATSKETQIKMNYTNEKAINLENAGVATSTLNIVAPVGVIALNSVTNTQTGETATSLGSEKKEVSLQRNTQKTTAKYTQTVINNESEPINGMKIIGRIGSEGDNLGSTISAKLASSVENTENIDYTVYYSEKADATEDLQDSSNGWTTEISQNAKSYLIVVNKQVEQGEELNFNYNIEVPENLEYGAEVASTYNVKYNTQAENLDKEATPVTLSTGNGPIIEATLEDNTVDGTVYVGQVVTYTVNVSNKGTADAENVKVTVPVPDGMVYTEKNSNIYDVEKDYIYKEDVKNIELDFGNIEKGNSDKKEFLLYAKEEKNTSIKAEVSCSNYADTESNEKNITIKKSSLNMKFNTDKEAFVGEYVGISFNLDTSETINNVKTKIKLPEELKYVSGSAFDYKNDKDLENVISYNEADRNIEINIDKIESNTIIISISVEAVKSNENIKLYAETNYSGNSQLSNTSVVSIYNLDTEIEAVSSIENNSSIKAGESIEYTLTIKNTSQKEIGYIYPRFKIPQEMEITNVYLNDKEITGDSKAYTFSVDDNSISLSEKIGVNESIKISVKVWVTKEFTLTEDKKVTTNISISELNYSKDFNYTIDKESTKDDEDNNSDNPNNPDNPGDSDNPSENKQYKISGTAWLDQNKDGGLGEEETKLSGITVKAINNNGEEKATTTTAENGTYTLENLTKGNYTVIFEYDTSKYMLTTYQKDGIDSSLNSKVVKGSYKEKTVATTNKIEISDRSIVNINIGLIEGSNFDLSLNKKVTQISMANTKKTQTKKYNTQLAKIDLDYKYINNTKVAIEYEITVTNEGDIPGYASKIIDYLPEGFDFSTELNKDWYTSNNNIETKALANTIINPGESKTVKLILTKNMNENGNGIYCNTAEIAESYNEYGQEDSDSTPGNNKEGEDDQSSANVILGLKTGGPVTYITLTITIMTLICIAAYEINKRVLKV